MSNARVCLLSSMACLLLAAPITAAVAQSGLRLAAETGREQTAWPRWQVRFGLATTASAVDSSTRWELSAGQMLGDYYWSGLRPAGASRSGGFRATSGLLLGPRSLALGAPALASAQGLSVTLSRSLRPAYGSSEAMAELWSVVPYIGIGYSGISVRGGWGFSADVGVAGAAGGLRTHRDSTLGTQGVDDVLRELRLTPVLQFGASYAF